MLNGLRQNIGAEMRKRMGVKGSDKFMGYSSTRETLTFSPARDICVHIVVTVFNGETQTNGSNRRAESHRMEQLDRGHIFVMAVFPIEITMLAISRSTGSIRDIYETSVSLCRCVCLYTFFEAVLSIRLAFCTGHSHDLPEDMSVRGRY